VTDSLVCEWCGRTFKRPATRGPVPSYCKPSHRQRAFEQRQHDRAVEAAVHLAVRRTERRLARAGR
jgi:hypothetical protein